jgi:sterol desaturase/sphingolipid hydroxylase (fatty acid hydroxylase superfamily)
MKEKHWLVRPQTVRRLWFGFGAVLVLLVLLDFFGTHQAKFTLDGWFGFYAVFGFLACIVLVFGSKALGLLLKRPDDYYDREQADEGREEERR